MIGPPTRRPGPVFFVHIEKTAGSSFVDGFLKPNYSDDQRVGSLRSVWENRASSCLHGHCPYGLHPLVDGDVRYITFLREPVDRAVSHYYFIKDLIRTDLFTRHPLRDYADSVTVCEFYENPRLANLQVRFMAGQAWHRMYPLLHRSKQFQERMLSAAKNNLHRCVAFGLKERYDDSINLMMQRLGVDRYVKVPFRAKTKERPTLAEIEEMSSEVLPRLAAANHLDVRFYAHAKTIFDHQTERNRSGFAIA